MKRREFLSVAARAGLAAGAAAAPTRLLAALPTTTVRGRVTGAEKPLAGVLVSNGCRVVRTDVGGRYELPVGPDSGRFLFVTTPRGYWTDRFYRPTAEAVRTGRADFALEPMDQPDRFDFAFLADIHLDRRPHGTDKFNASLREINRLEPTPRFVLAQGDICLESGVGDRYVECLSSLQMPVRNGAGNHEMMLEHENPRDDFERRFGPTYYSFDFGPIHVVVLDGNKPIPAGDGAGYKAVHGAVEGRELAWLAADLEAQPEGKPIVVGVHIPIVSTYPERRDQSPKDAPYWEMANDRTVTDLLSRHKVRLVLQGHMHENERATVGGVEYVESISISGCWWNHGAGFERGVDGAPRGYRIVSVDGTNVTHRYRSSCESFVEGQAEFVGLGPTVPADKAMPVVLNCYDAPNGSTAELRIDGGPWRPMPAFAAPSPYTKGLSMPHHFRLSIDTAALSPGRHAIAARVEWPDSTVVIEEAAFESGGR